MARKKQEEAPEGGGFIVLFTSLSIILLAFFILLNSLATLDDKKVKKALGSLTAVFSGFGSGPMFPRADSLVQIGDQIALLAKGPGQSLKDAVDDALEKEQVEGDVELKTDGDDVLLVFPDHVVFDSGEAYLKLPMKRVLDALAPKIQKLPYPLVVEGHTDDRPIHTARYPSNWELSTARAGAVVRYFIERHGLDPDQLRGEGYAEFRPVAPNQTLEGRAKNRRVVLRFVGMNPEANNGDEIPQQKPQVGI